MASKKKKKKVGSSDLATIAERELDKGNSKQALKQAKICYRQDKSEATRGLLQRAFLMRGKQLHAKSMFEHARSAIIEMDELGEIKSEYTNDAARLRLLLGIGSGDTVDSAAASEIQQELADQAVVFGPTSVTDAELQKSAGLIRRALEAVEAAKPDQAIELVNVIERDSLFADWKLFLRGLVAYYDQDEDRTLANWSRLNPNRAAKRIADVLSIVAEYQPYKSAPAELRAKVDGLARSQGGGIVGSLQRLKRSLLDPDGDPQSLRASVLHFMNTHAKSEPRLSQRVAQVVIDYVIDDDYSDVDDLDRLKKVLPPLPFDPQLNRAFALIHEMHTDLRSTERCWNGFVQDLREHPELNESQRPTAIALVYERIASEFTQAAREARHFAVYDLDGGDHEKDLLRQADAYLQKACQSDPKLLEVHSSRLLILELLDNHSAAASGHRQTAERFRDNFDVQMAAAHYFNKHGQPGVAADFAQAARNLRPRDEAAVELAWISLLGTARVAAKQKQIRLAESELEKAEQISSPKCPMHRVLALRAAVAFKDGNRQQGEAFLHQAAAELEVPTAVLLIVHSESLRCGVNDRDVLIGLKARLEKALKSFKKNAQAASMMASYVQSMKSLRVEYRGMATHVKQVTTYLNQSARLKWSHSHLQAACRFAFEEDLAPLLTKLAKRGRTLFKHSPYFHFYLGQAQMILGPSGCNYGVAIKAFNKAIELNKHSDIKLEAEECNQASESLGHLERGPAPSLPDIADLIDLGGASERIDDAKMKELIREMPPELRAQLERKGIPLEVGVELILKLALNGMV